METFNRSFTVVAVVTSCSAAAEVLFCCTAAIAPTIATDALDVDIIVDDVDDKRFIFALILISSSSANSASRLFAAS